MLILLGLNMLTKAQSKTVKGEIIDSKTGDALIGASVINKSDRSGGVTDYLGEFLVDLENCQSTVYEISYLGYKNLIVDFVEIKEFWNIELEESNTNIDEVVISMAKFAQKREEITASISTIAPQDIDRQASSDIRKVLGQTSGVVAYQNQLNIRNSNGYMYGVGSRVILLLDGLPLLTADQSSIDFDFLPIDDIKSIEILKGASSVLYGAGALGGVINVITNRIGKEPRTTLRYRQEIFDKPKNDLINWEGAYTTSMHYTHSKRFGNLDFGIQADYINEDGYREGEYQQTFRTLLSAFYYPNKNPNLRFGGRVGFATDEMADFLTWKSYPNHALDIGNVDITSQEFIKFFVDPMISYINKKGDTHRYISRHYFSFRDTNEGNSNSGTLFNEYQYTSSPFKWLKLISGLNYTYGYVKAELFGKHNMHSMGIFMQANAKLGRWNLSAGARYLNDILDGDNIVNRPVFRAGANYRLGKATYLRASIGQGVRNPSIAERYAQVNVGSLILVPTKGIDIEYGYTAEAGVRQLFALGEWKGMFDAVVFHMRFNDMIEFDIFSPDSIDLLNLTAQFAATNLSNVSINGVEFTTGFSGKIGRIKMGLQAGYTFSNPIDLNGDPELDGQLNYLETLLDSVEITQFTPEIKFTAYVKPDRPRTLKFRNKHLFRSSLNFNYGKVDFTMNYRYISKTTNQNKIFYYEPWQLIDPAVSVLVNEYGIDEEFSTDLVEDFLEDSEALVPGLYDYTREKASGANFVDLVFGLKLKNNYFSFHIFNLLNEEFVPLAGYLVPHRSYAFQYKLEL